MKNEESPFTQSATHPALQRTHRVLILGGTGEALRLAEHLSQRSDLAVVSSLAGRVDQPTIPAGEVRIGGFGGVAGLIEYLVTHGVDIVIDATHPFAAKISSHAELACRRVSIPLIALERPAWRPQQGDRWVPVPTFESAALLADELENRVFLSIGRQELDAFSECSKAWFLIRTIDKPTAPLPQRSRLILSRGPFQLGEERLMLRQEAITHIVSKNSGGTATQSKIEAARELGIEVIMVERPAVARSNPYTTVDHVYSRLEQLLRGHMASQLDSPETKRL
jgi:precorrin-6A/cobalt-precorrin-6A reductase